MPCTVGPWCMITPPPMKPMPVTTPAAITIGLLVGPRPSEETIVNTAAPTATNVWVRRPAFL